MRTLRQIFVSVGLLVCASGCATRTVVIDSAADVVRLGPDVRGTVYVLRDKAWVKTSAVKLPEGWYAGPMPAN